MAGEERERSFEKALARNLRASASERTGVSRRGACAEAETLAAYHERLLAPEEMTFWKEHITGCARCQQILAHVEETEGIAVDAAAPQESVVGARVEGGLAGYSKDALAMPAARSGASVLHVAAPRRAKRWVWAAVIPAGAIAAGVLVWVTLNQREKPLEMARNQTAPVTLPSVPLSEAAPAARGATPKAQAPTAPTAAKRDESQSNTAELYSKTPTLSENSLSDRRKEGMRTALDERKATAAAKKALPITEGASRMAQAGVGRGVGGGRGVVGGQLGAAEESNAVLQADKTKDLPAEGRNATSLITVAPGTPAAAPAPAPPPPPVPAMSESVEVASGAAAGTTTPAPAVDELSKTKAGAPAPAAPKGGQQAQVQRQETQQMQGMSRFREKQDFRLANVKSPAVIAAPGGKVSWRVGVAGTIERSEDGGATWTLQSSGVVADLLAGAAVSEKVCWVAGRLGTILRTTDGGAHWVKVQAPTQDDIPSVFAVSADQATISTGQGTYRTEDGGATWKKLATQ